MDASTFGFGPGNKITMNDSATNGDAQPAGVALLKPPSSALAQVSVALGPGPAAHRNGLHRWVVLVGLVLAGAGGLAWYAGLLDLRELRDWLPWGERRELEVLTLFGNIDVRQVNLAFKVDGRVATLAVDEGDAVKAGTVVATLDRPYFEDDLRLARTRRDSQAATLARLEHGSRPEEIAEARALVAQREASAVHADKLAIRLANLVARKSATSDEFETDDAAAKVARAELESSRQALRLAVIGPRVEDIDTARANLASAETELSQADRRREDSRIVAPSHGTILTRSREVGAIVQPGETVFTLTLASPVWVRTYVSEPDLGRARPGSEVEVLTDSEPKRPYRGHVGYISPTAEFTPKTVETKELRTRLVYRVRIVVDDPDGGLRQGMPVTVRLPQPRRAVGSSR